MEKCKWRQLANTWVIVVLIVVMLSGCSVKKIQYDTICNQQKLLDLKGKKLVILSFEYRDSPLADYETLEPAVAQKIVDAQKTKFMSEFGSLFDIEDVSTDFSLLRDRKPSIDNPHLVSEILQELDADGGILITNAYGYELTPGDTVQFFFFASDTYIMDKEGNVVWNFYGKAGASPGFLETIKPGEMIRSVFGQPPSDQRLIQAMGAISDIYTEYIRWLVEADIDNLPNKNYFIDYPEERRNDDICIFPASEKYHAPFLSDVD